MKRAIATSLALSLIASLLAVGPAAAQVAVRGRTIHTMAGAPIKDGIVVIQDGKISAIGRADQIAVPDDFTILEAEVVTPGLIDAHSTLGFSGILNVPHDQDQFDRSAPVQPELRAIDAYNPGDYLIAWVRGFGVTTIHAGHAPGELISGQTLIAKTSGNTVADTVIDDATAVAATLTTAAHKPGGKSPGTRGKSMAMLRTQLIKAREYLEKHKRAAKEDKSESPPRNLRLEVLGRVLEGEQPLLITADRARDISSALRLAAEFDIDIWLDGACESYLVIDDIKKAGVPVIIHPPMQRAARERENLSFETASKLVKAGIPVAMQSGYESYVPKSRVVLFEAALAAANGLSFEEALRTITIDAAKILGIDERVGSLEVGKDGDVALYDGDPFEYTSHCIGCIIEGRVVSDERR